MKTYKKVPKYRKYLKPMTGLAYFYSDIWNDTGRYIVKTLHTLNNLLHIAQRHMRHVLSLLPVKMVSPS